jgi:hypothetical protein
MFHSEFKAKKLFSETNLLIHVFNKQRGFHVLFSYSASNLSLIVLYFFSQDSPRSPFTYFYPRMDLQYFWWSPLMQPLIAHLAILSKTLHPGSDRGCYVMSNVTPFNLPVPATTSVQVCYIYHQEVTKKQFQ